MTRPEPQTSLVLHLNSGNLYGGVETILVTLARLRDLCPGMESHFGLCHDGRLSRELLEAGVPVHNMGAVRISRPWTVWRARRHLREILSRTRYDLVVCHMPWSLAVFGPAVHAAGQRLGFWAHAFHTGTGWLERLAHRSAPDLAIANSRFTERGLATFFSETPRVVVYPPVPLAPLPEGSRSRSTLRQELGAGGDRVVVIQVSRMEACKGHSVHLEALARLQHLSTPWQCWMVGGAQRPEEKEYVSGLQRTISALGLSDRVQFLGQRADVPALLGAADIFCQPNETPDSFGISFIEALWAGRPVITSALGGALEIVDDSCGVLVQPGNVAELAAALEGLIGQPELRANLALNGPARASGLCNPQTQMDILASLSRNGKPGAIVQ